jgi:FG-GAP-like repeat/Secretion system C-terminal sorting domain
MRIWIIVISAALLPCILTAQITWEEHTIDGDYGRATSGYATDVDGDGDGDMIGAKDGSVTWWENVNGDGLSWSEHFVAGFGGSRCIYATDVDGDGDTDVLGAGSWHPGGGEIKWWENVDGVGLNWTEHWVEESFDSARSVYAKDVDGDGDIDILGAADVADDITWWENMDNIGTSWVEHTVDGEYNGANSVFSTDVDGDGDNDVLGGSSYATWWENMDGTGLSWTQHTVSEFGGKVYATDVDGDGDYDVLGASGSTIAWWENMDGDGLSWTEHLVDTDFTYTNCVCATDVDGDGDCDVLGAADSNQEGGEIAWWENVDGAAQIWSKQSIDGDFDGARGVYTTDVDGDGDTDVLGVAYDANDITWWENIQPCLTIELEPFGAPIFIHGRGGHFDFKIRIVNRSNDLVWFTAWTEAILPNGNLYSPIMLNNFVCIGPYSGYLRVVTQAVPRYAPMGEYQYFVRLGNFPELTLSLDSFSFSKVYGVTTDPPVADWSVSGFNDVAATNPPNLPAEYRVESAHPNPFNPTTTIAIALPEVSDLTMVVYNVAGQQVATLSDGLLNAGKHNFTFDATGLASGIYFVHANVPDRLDSMQKIVLVK